MNIVILEGNVATDVVTKEVSTKDGRSSTVANFRVAVNRFFKKKDDTRKKDTDFFDCEAWDSGAETLKKYVTKGDPILINGSLKSENWEHEGKTRSRTKVRINSFKKLNRYHPSDTPAPVPVEVQETEGEDIPF
jgi:single-strand DNA-binding protein